MEQVATAKQPPVTATGTTVVGATRDVVWDIISDIEGWPSWNPDVREAHLEGSLEPGTRFDWKAGPGTIHSELTDVTAPSTISWTGSMLGIEAVHTWSLEEAGSGTRVTTDETWTGLLPKIFPKSMTKSLQKAIDKGLEAIRKAAESR